MIRATARYEPRALVRTYLYGIAFKLLAAERRKRARDQPADLSPVTADDFDDRLWVRQAIERLAPTIARF